MRRPEFSCGEPLISSCEYGAANPVKQFYRPLTNTIWKIGATPHRLETGIRCREERWTTDIIQRKQEIERLLNPNKMMAIHAFLANE